MSGVRGIGMAPYSHIKPRACPVCGKNILNFEAHTRQLDKGHQDLRRLQKEAERKLLNGLLIQQSVTDMNLLSDSGVCTAMTQTAWDKAIKQFSIEKES